MRLENGFRLTLQPLPREFDPTGIVRLRRALKCLLRSFALRCTRVEPVRPRTRQGRLFP